MKIALVQDWLTEIGGAEKVFAAFLELYPEADVFTLTSQKKVIAELGISQKRLHESFISKLPLGRKHYRLYLPFYAKAIESFDFSEYDLIISSSSSVAKGIIKNSNQLHICYCHSPVRYAWDLYHHYLRESKLSGFGLRGFIARHVLHKLRIWDIISANRVDVFIANSNYIKKRIWNVYKRDAIVIYPPVNVELFPLKQEKGDYFFSASRMVPYKKIDLIVRVFNELKDKRLIIAGDGPDYEKIKKIAGLNVELLGFVSNEELICLMGNAKAFVFAADEDFGIIPVEAQACGTPVIAYGRGGALETVVDGVTGIYFEEQEEGSLREAIRRFEMAGGLKPYEIRKNAEKFSKERFMNAIKEVVDKATKDFFG